MKNTPSAETRRLSLQQTSPIVNLSRSAILVKCREYCPCAKCTVNIVLYRMSRTNKTFKENIVATSHIFSSLFFFLSEFSNVFSEYLIFFSLRAVLVWVSVLLRHMYFLFLCCVTAWSLFLIPLYFLKDSYCFDSYCLVLVRGCLAQALLHWLWVKPSAV